MLVIHAMHIMIGMQVMRWAAVSGTGSVSETEKGQATVITRHGAVTNVHKHGQERKVSHI